MLAPVTIPTDPKIDLLFDNNQTDLSNIDAVVYLRKVIHKVQTTESFLRPFIGHHMVEGTFDFVTLTGKRDPKKQTNVFRPLSDITNFTKQSFEVSGIYVEPYDDMAWIPGYVQTYSRINFDGSVAVAMMSGFTRLEDRQIQAATVMPIIKTDTTPQASGTFQEGWKRALRNASNRSLPNTQIFGFMDNSVLLKPEFNAIQLMKNAFKKQNVGPSLQLCAVLTPTMLIYLQQMDEFKNRDYVYHTMPDAQSTQPMGVHDWFGIKWVEITPEVELGAYYSGKYFPKTANATTKSLNSATDTAGSNFALSSSNHEVLPFWVSGNLFLGHKPSLDRWGIILQPTYMNEAVMYGRNWTGGTRVQDVLQAHLVIPTLS